MIKTYAAACLLGTALVAAPAVAQQSTPMAADSGQFMTQMTSDQWRGSKLVGVDVYGTDNAKIGDINEVIVDRSGSVKAVVIGVGGFLGIGEKNVAIPYDKIQWNSGGAASSGMAANTSAPAPANNTTSSGLASTATGSSNDSAMTGASRQTTSSGGASLSPPPAADSAAPANSTAMTTNSTSSTATTASTSASTTAQDYPERAMVQMSKQDLQNAPEFHYASQANSASKSGSGTNASGMNR